VLNNYTGEVDSECAIVYSNCDSWGRGSGKSRTSTIVGERGDLGTIMGIQFAWVNIAF
jgi:hypothetical protein